MVQSDAMVTFRVREYECDSGDIWRIGVWAVRIGKERGPWSHLTKRECAERQLPILERKNMGPMC